MYPLPVPLNLAIKDRIFILRQHLGLGRHLFLPALDALHALSVARERIVQGCDDGVDFSEALAVAVLLMAGEAPWDFPFRSVLAEVFCCLNSELRVEMGMERVSVVGDVGEAL